MMIIVALCFTSFALISLFQEQTGAFDDLGKLLLGGVTAAVVVAVGFTLIRFRLPDKKLRTRSSSALVPTKTNQQQVVPWPIL